MLVVECPFFYECDDECVLCDGRQFVEMLENPKEYENGVYLCYACSKGRPDDCSGWCGVYFK
jgi:hypothetical protein